MDARHRRRTGLQQVNRVTSWLAGGAVVVCGAFVGLLARPAAGAGHANHPALPSSSPSTTGPTLGSSGDGSGAIDDGGAPVVQPSPPTQAPVSASGGSQVTTGAS
jgi:hypothetical protein